MLLRSLKTGQLNKVKGQPGKSPLPAPVVDYILLQPRVGMVLGGVGFPLVPDRPAKGVGMRGWIILSKRMCGVLRSPCPIRCVSRTSPRSCSRRPSIRRTGSGILPDFPQGEYSSPPPGPSVRHRRQRNRRAQRWSAWGCPQGRPARCKREADPIRILAVLSVRPTSTPLT